MWNLRRLCDKVLTTPETIVNWCVLMGLLKSTPYCDHCGEEMVNLNLLSID